MSHCTGYGNCHQGRAPCKTEWACNVRTKNGGESVDNGLLITMEEPMDDPIRRGNVIATCIWLLASAVLIGFAVGVYGIWLS